MPFVMLPSIYIDTLNDITNFSFKVPYSDDTHLQLFMHIISIIIIDYL